MSDILERLLLLDHFEFEYNESEQAYQFLTEGGYKYSITFQEFFMFEAPVYMFNIDRVKTKDDATKGKQGFAIRNTVMLILTAFFENIDNAIVAICESKDKHERARHKLFNQWYKDAKNLFDVTWIVRDDAPFPMSSGEEQYAMLYYHKDNMFAQIIKEQFRELVEHKFFME